MWKEYFLKKGNIILYFTSYKLECQIIIISKPRII